MRMDVLPLISTREKCYFQTLYDIFLRAQSRFTPLNYTDYHETIQLQCLKDFF